MSPFSLDRAAARRAFSRAAGTYDQAAVLHREVAARLMERLECIRLDPRRVLDAGCGTGAALPALAGRYRRAQVLGLDFALPMLAAARRRRRWRRSFRLLGGDLHALPLAAGTVDLVFSNLALQWCDPAAVFAEFRRLLAPGGLLMFTTFGPDTLKELRAAWAAVDPAPRVHEFEDMHNLGDMLLAAGFGDPVMDVEYFTLTYRRLEDLVADLRGLGARNAAAARPRGLTGRGRLAALRAACEAYRDADGRLAVTYEVVYGHAWAGPPAGGGVAVAPPVRGG